MKHQINGWSTTAKVDILDWPIHSISSTKGTAKSVSGNRKSSLELHLFTPMETTTESVGGPGRKKEWLWIDRSIWSSRLEHDQISWSGSWPRKSATKRIHCTVGLIHFSECKLEGPIESVKADFLPFGATASFFGWGYKYPSIWPFQGCKSLWKLYSCVPHIFKCSIHQSAQEKIKAISESLRAWLVLV